MVQYVLGAGAVLAVLYWAFYCHAGPSAAKSAVKTGSVLALAVAAWAVGGPWVLLLALLLCALGDYLLSRPGEAAFMAGVGAFAAGHLAYVALFLGHPTSDLARLGDHPGQIAVLALFGAAMIAVLWPRAGELRGPVAAYVPIILSMGVSVLALPQVWPVGLAQIAALLFILSDFTLSMEMFVLPEGRMKRLAPFVVWPTYWLAQLGFVLGFAVLAG